MSFKIIVTGDYACFTRPEMKVERVSYDVPTPGALEGMLKAIYWKPAIRYKIERIVVFNPISFTNIRRNEFKEKVSFSAVKRQMKGGDASPEQFASEQRTQRASMILKDVMYGVEFRFEMTGQKSREADEVEEKHYNIILRRLKKGQHFRQPCLGCREFSVREVRLVDEFDLSLVSPELKGEVDLGYMLYDMKFLDGGVPINGDWDSPKFSDEAQAQFYRPKMVDGVIEVERYWEAMTC